MNPEQEARELEQMIIGGYRRPRVNLRAEHDRALREMCEAHSDRMDAMIFGRYAAAHLKVDEKPRHFMEGVQWRLTEEDERRICGPDRRLLLCAA